jgi:hypothetical protein
MKAKRSIQSLWPFRSDGSIHADSELSKAQPPFGPKVKPPAKPEPPEWQSVPDKPHLEINRKGQIRTRLPLPSSHN